MTVPNVRKGQALSAQTWNQLASTVNNLTSGSTERQWGRSIPCTVLNRSGSARYGGNILTVYKGGSVRLAAYKPDEARIAWLNSGFQLDGYAGSTNEYGAPALLIDGVGNGEIARCIVPGLCAGFLTYTENDVPELCKFDADNGVFCSAGDNEVGDWKVIAASDIETGVKRVFAYLVPASIGDLQRQASKLPWGGGSSSSSSSSGDSFADNIRNYFECSDAVKDPVLMYDLHPDSSGDTPIHPTSSIVDIVYEDAESTAGDKNANRPPYVMLATVDEETGEVVREIGFYSYGWTTDGSPDSFVKVDGSASTAPSGVEIDLKSTSSDNLLGVDVLTAASSSNVTYLTSVGKTTSRPTITCTGTFVTSPGTATNALSAVTPTTGSIGISGTNGTQPLSSVSLLGGSAVLATTQNNNEGIEVVTSINCVNGQLIVNMARLVVNYTGPTLDPAYTSLSITGGQTVVTALTPQTVSVLQANTATTGSPTASLDSDVVTDISTSSSTDALVTGATTTKIGATLRGLSTFTPAYEGIETDPPAYGSIVRGEPIVATKRSNAVTTYLLDCGESSSSSSSSSGSSSSSSSSSESESSSSSSDGDGGEGEGGEDQGTTAED